MPKAKLRPNRSLLQPLSMEDRTVYFARFDSHTEMNELFSDSKQRRQIAYDIFNECWQDAAVRVTREDGSIFFID